MQPGQGRILRCLKQHEAEVSQACKDKRASFREEMEEVRAACKEDAQKLCAGVQPGGGRIARCLQQHKDQLSDACRKEGEQIARRREGHRALLKDVQQACKDDVQKFCAEVKPGGGRLARCLRAHQNELSSVCTDTVEEAKDRW